MMDQGQAPWNDGAKISCEFAFKCPQTWARLAPTEDATIRHCSECDREVHLTLTEKDLVRHKEVGHCIAVRLLTDAEAQPLSLVGMLHP